MTELEILTLLKGMNWGDILMLLILILVIRGHNSSLLQAIKNRLTSPSHQIDIDEHIRVHQEVNIILEDLREKTHAEMVFVLQFHNGDENLAGVPFGKFSMTHESFAYGLRSIMKDFQSVPLPMILHLLVQIKRLGTYLVPDIDALAAADVQTHYLFNNYCMRSFAIEPLTDAKGTMTGLLCVADILRSREMPAERVALIEAASQRLGSLIGAWDVQE